MAKTVILGIFILSVLVVMYATTDLAFGTHMLQGDVTLDKDSEMFTISAEAEDTTTLLVTGYAPRTAQEAVTIKVTAPNGNLVSIDQVAVDSTYHYMAVIKTNPELWTVNGAYLITAHQSPGSQGTVYADLWDTSFVSTNVEVVDGLIVDFKINYQAEYGYVTYIQAEPDSNSLIVSIETEIYDVRTEIFQGAPRDGTLTIELPRDVIDAKIMDTDIDDKFVVLVDGENTPYEETIASSVRTLTIPFPYGSNEVKIMGSSVDSEYGISIVPEFGISTAPEFGIELEKIQEPLDQANENLIEDQESESQEKTIVESSIQAEEKQEFCFLFWCW